MTVRTHKHKIRERSNKVNKRVTLILPNRILILMSHSRSLHNSSLLIWYPTTFYCLLNMQKKMASVIIQANKLQDLVHTNNFHLDVLFREYPKSSQFLEREKEIWHSSPVYLRYINRSKILVSGSVKED